MNAHYEAIKVENLIYKDENHNFYELTAEEQSVSFTFLFNLYYDEEQKNKSNKTKIRTDIILKLGLSMFEYPGEEIIDIILENMQ